MSQGSELRYNLAQTELDGSAGPWTGSHQAAYSTVLPFIQQGYIKSSRVRLSKRQVLQKLCSCVIDRLYNEKIYIVLQVRFLFQQCCLKNVMSTQNTELWISSEFFNYASREVNTNIYIFVTLKLYLPTGLQQFNFNKINFINLNMSIFDTCKMCYTRTVDKVWENRYKNTMVSYALLPCKWWYYML